MKIMKYSPSRGLWRLGEELSNLFTDDFFKRGFADFGLLGRRGAAAVDLYETGEAVVLKAEVPGMKEKDLSIEIEDNTLRLKGEKKEEHEVKSENYYHKEISYGNFQRVFSIPARINSEAIKAELKNGILTITMPKAEEAKARRVEIKE